MRDLVDEFYKKLYVTTSNKGEPFKILSISPGSITSPITISLGKREFTIACQELYDLFTSVKIRFAPLMTPKLYESMFEYDELESYPTFMTDETFFKSVNPLFLENFKDMTANEACISVFKEEKYYAFVERRPNDPPIHLLTVPRLKKIRDPKVAYILYKELFQVIFETASGSSLILTDYFDENDQDDGAIFWRSFFASLKKTKTKPSEILVVQNHEPKTTRFYKGLSVENDNFESDSNRKTSSFEYLAKEYLPYIESEVKKIKRNPLSVAIESSRKKKTYVIVFCDPKDVFTPNVGGEFNQDVSKQRPVELFARHGTSSFTSLGLVEPIIIESNRKSDLCSQRCCRVLDNKGKWIDFPLYKYGLFGKRPVSKKSKIDLETVEYDVSVLKQMVTEAQQAIEDRKLQNMLESPWL